MAGERRDGGDNEGKKGWRGEERDGEGKKEMARGRKRWRGEGKDGGGKKGIVGGRGNGGGKKKWRGKEERNRMESGSDRKKEAFHVEI